MASKRIGKELAEITANPLEGIQASLVDESDLHEWLIVMDGPPGSPYASGHFKLLLRLPADYPFKPPTLTFRTKIYHPNVTAADNHDPNNPHTGRGGLLCLGMLRTEEWKPSSKIAGVLATARQLLAEPNPDDAIETGIAEQYRKGRREFEKIAREWVKKYAKK